MASLLCGVFSKISRPAKRYRHQNGGHQRAGGGTKSEGVTSVVMEGHRASGTTHNGAYRCLVRSQTINQCGPGGFKSAQGALFISIACSAPLASGIGSVRPG